MARAVLPVKSGPKNLPMKIDPMAMIAVGRAVPETRKNPPRGVSSATFLDSFAKESFDLSALNLYFLTVDRSFVDSVKENSVQQFEIYDIANKLIIRFPAGHMLLYNVCNKIFTEEVSLQGFRIQQEAQGIIL